MQTNQSKTLISGEVSGCISLMPWTLVEEILAEVCHPMKKQMGINRIIKSAMKQIG